MIGGMAELHQRLRLIATFAIERNPAPALAKRAPSEPFLANVVRDVLHVPGKIVEEIDGEGDDRPIGVRSPEDHADELGSVIIDKLADADGIAAIGRNDELCQGDSPSSGCASATVADACGDGSSLAGGRAA